MIRKTTLRVTTAGEDGSATGTATTEEVVVGRILAVKVDYGATAPATTDLTLAQRDEVVPGNIVALTDNATDKTLYPVVQNTDSAGSAVTGEYMPYFVADKLVATVAGSNALAPAVTLDIYWEESR